MDDHIAKMLSDGWEILTQTSHTGDRRILRPFAKRDTITVSFRKELTPVSGRCYINSKERRVHRRGGTFNSTSR